MNPKKYYTIIFATFLYFITPLTFAETNAVGDNMADMMLDMMDGVGFINKSNYIDSRASNRSSYGGGLMGNNEYMQWLQFKQWQNYMNPSQMGMMPLYGMSPMTGMNPISSMGGGQLPGMAQAQSLMGGNKNKLPMADLIKQMPAFAQQKKQVATTTPSYQNNEDYQEYYRWKLQKEQAKELTQYRYNTNELYPQAQATPVTKSYRKEKATDLDGRWMSNTGDIMTIGYGRFKIQQMNNQVYRGDIRSKGRYISMRMKESGKVRNFEYVIKEDKLALRGESGDLLLFKKQPSYE